MAAIQPLRTSQPDLVAQINSLASILRASQKIARNSAGVDFSYTCIPTGPLRANGSKGCLFAPNGKM